MCSQHNLPVHGGTVAPYIFDSVYGGCKPPVFGLAHSSHIQITIFEPAATDHTAVTCKIQSCVFSTHATSVLQVWVRDVLEAQQVLDYRTGQRSKKSEVATFLHIH